MSVISKNKKTTGRTLLAAGMVFALIASATFMVVLSDDFASDAEPYVQNNVKYSLYIDGGERYASVTGNNGVSGDLVIPDEVKLGDLKYKVTSIGKGAFSNSGNLEKVTLPAGLKTIGSSAFSGCGKMTITNENIIPAGVTSIGNYAFADCKKLTGGKDMVIPDAVETLGDWVFTRCNDGISKVTLPANLKTIGPCAFADNTKMTITNENIIPAGVTSIGGSAFRGCASIGPDLVIPDVIETIENTAFSGCSSLVNATLPANLKAIGYGAFSGCGKMTITNENIIPAGVTSIGNYAFADCKKLTGGKDMVIPDAVETLGDWVFTRCNDGISKVTLPANLKTIGPCAFADNTKMTITNENIIPAGVTSIGGSAFRGCASIGPNLVIPDVIETIENMAFNGCSSLVNATLPANLKTIGYSAFSGCGKMTITNENIIPAGVTSIGNYAFADCKKLTGGKDMVIPDAVETLGDWVFTRCNDGISQVTLPANLKTIGPCAFSDNTKMTVTNPGILPEGVTTIGNDAFRGCSSIGSELVIPETLTSMKNNAFTGCSSVTELTFKGASVPEIGNNSLSFGTYAQQRTTPPIILNSAFTDEQIDSFDKVAIRGNYTKFDRVPLIAVTVACEGSNGTVVPGSGEYKVVKGKDFAMAFTHDEGFRIDMTVNSSVVEVSGNSYTFTVTEPTAVSVKFVRQFIVELPSSEGGSVNFFGEASELRSKTFDIGSDVALEIVPAEGYRLKSLTVDGEAVEVVDGKFTISGISSVPAIAAEWQLVRIVTIDPVENGKVLYSLDGENYNEYTGPFEVDDGAQVFFKAVPDEGFAIKSASVDGEIVAVSDGVFSKSVTGPTAVAVEFVRQFIVELPSSEGGSVNFFGEASELRSKTFDIGSDVALEIVPAEGYRLKSLTVDGTSVEVIDGKFTLSGISSVPSIVAEWQLVRMVTIDPVENGKVLYSLDGENYNEYTGPFEVDDGTQIFIKVIPDSGFVIDSVSVNGVPEAGDQPYKFVASSDVKITAVIKKAPSSQDRPVIRPIDPVVTYVNVRITAGDGGTVPLKGVRAVAYGADLIIAAIPDEGYKVATVTIDGKDVDPSDLIFLHAVISDTEVVVSFMEVAPVMGDSDLDPMSGTMWIIIAILAMVAIWLFIVAKRRRDDEEETI